MLPSSEAPTSAATGGEIVLFGVRVKVDPMRKSVSMNNLSEYEPVAIDGSKNNETPKAEAEDGAAGYASADDAVPQPSGGSRERKRGVPWTEEEHKLFLLGLQKVGKGDWRGISRNYVKTRTPTQVASHAQKYFLRRSNINRRRRRSSLFDITTDSVSEMPVEEAKNHEESPVQPPSSGNGFSVVPFPMTMTPPVMFSMQNSSMAQTDNSSPFLIRPVCSSSMMDLSLRQQQPSPLSLRLSLSSGQDQPSISIRASDSQRMSGFNDGNGDGIITVA